MNTIVKPPVKTPNKAPEKTPEPSGSGGHSRSAARSMFDPAIVMPAIADSFRKLCPRTQLRNPVMFCVYIGSILTTVLWLAALSGQAEAPAGFILAVSLWLWFTVLFANFAEELAEGRSKAQAASLRSAKRDVMAKKLESANPKSSMRITTATELRKGDIVLIETGDVIPADGEVIEGVVSRRVRDHGRIRSGDPRIRRRLYRGDGWYPCAVRLDCGARDGQSGRGVPRPHDRDGGRRQASKNA